MIKDWYVVGKRAILIPVFVILTAFVAILYLPAFAHAGTFDFRSALSVPLSILWCGILQCILSFFRSESTTAGRVVDAAVVVLVLAMCALVVDRMLIPPDSLHVVYGFPHGGVAYPFYEYPADGTGFTEYYSSDIDRIRALTDGLRGVAFYAAFVLGNAAAFAMKPKRIHPKA
ncbi:MAG: hypothetical protein WC509_05940 [Candidatus Izemoplasmatales bacterium]